MKKRLLVILCLILCFTLCACNEEEAAPSRYFENENVTQPEEISNPHEIVILYTNDIHNAYLRDEASGRLGYASIAARKAELEKDGKFVILLDGGDALMGAAIGTFTEGAAMADLMNEVGYSFCVPGLNDFPLGIDRLKELDESHSGFSYVACNLLYAESGETVFEPYGLVEYEDLSIAITGIVSPVKAGADSGWLSEEYTLCHEENGEALYKAVQSAVDGAYAEGADYVVCIGHTGTDPDNAPWTTSQILMNTTGISLYLDASSHLPYSGELIDNMDGKPVPVYSNADSFSSFAEIYLHTDSGEISGEIVTEYEGEDSDTLTYMQTVTDSYEQILDEIIALNDVPLILNDPETGEKIIGSCETNLGDFCADAYRTVLGTDIAFVRSGEIYAQLPSGALTNRNILSVQPYQDAVYAVEVSGQEILDALEMAYRFVGESESSAFLQISGLSCKVDTQIPSTVVLDEDGSFLKVAGARRVTEVFIGTQPVEPDKVYTLAASSFFLNGADGFTMFRDNMLREGEFLLDHQVLLRYLKSGLSGIIPKYLYENPYGDGRITVLIPEPIPETVPEETQ